MKVFSRNLFKRLIRDQRGATAVEYVLLAVAVAGALAAIVFTLGDSIVNMFSGTQDALGNR